MNRTMVLVPVAAVLLAMAGSLWAQGGDSAGEPNNPDTSDTPAASRPENSSTDPSGAGSTPSAGASESRDSPFDYEASEQISEDLSVSFPGVI